MISKACKKYYPSMFRKKCVVFCKKMFLNIFKNNWVNFKKNLGKVATLQAPSQSFYGFELLLLIITLESDTASYKTITIPNPLKIFCTIKLLKFPNFLNIASGKSSWLNLDQKILVLRKIKRWLGQYRMLIIIVIDINNQEKFEVNVFSRGKESYESTLIFA